MKKLFIFINRYIAESDMEFTDEVEFFLALVVANMVGAALIAFCAL